jgi:hypothetical protein
MATSISYNEHLMILTTNALEHSAHFLFEERTKPYRSTVREYSQKKNVLNAKNSRRAAGSAGWQVREVR